MTTKVNISFHADATVVMQANVVRGVIQIETEPLEAGDVDVNGIYSVACPSGAAYFGVQNLGDSEVYIRQAASGATHSGGEGTAIAAGDTRFRRRSAATHLHIAESSYSVP